ncbi:MAG: DUF1573 domain-containing protein, partial [Candidatus Omnitrophica bacterium]|nr:DUF1573 domain-containing protein [Candidatus Omnitrophota bacterium]
SKNLNIKKVDTSCGCTTSDLSSTTVAGNSSIPIEVKFDTRGYKGKVQQHLWIYTDSKDFPLIKFTIEAEVIE